MDYGHYNAKTWALDAYKKKLKEEEDAKK